MICIFCDIENQAKSIEHIVSESFGNKDYVMERSSVCDTCNARFSKFEGTALSNTVFVAERASLGIKSKKGRTAKGTIEEISIEGNKDFKKQYITVKGLSQENFKEFDPVTRIGKLYIKAFDKSEVCASKLLLKIGLEAFYKSQHKIFKKYNFKALKDFLATRSNDDWPFLTTDFELKPFSGMTSFITKHRLKQNSCELKYCEFDENTLLFKFKFGAIAMTINLMDRNLDWIKQFQEGDSKIMLYPEHFRTKIR